MGVALLVSRIALALVFAVAGLAKLADRAGSRKAIVDFGLPAPLAGPLGVLLPLAELTVAVALIPTATAWWGAVGGLVLLFLFIGGISVNLARGRKPDCHCFGQIYSSPAGWSTLIRNGVLAAIAGFIIWSGHADPGPGVAGELDRLTTAGQLGLVGGVVMLAILAAIGWVMLNLVRQNGRLLLRIEALESRLGPPAQHLSRFWPKYLPHQKLGCLSRLRRRASASQDCTVRCSRLAHSGLPASRSC